MEGSAPIVEVKFSAAAVEVEGSAAIVEVTATESFTCQALS